MDDTQPSLKIVCLIKEKQLELENLYSGRVNGIINRARANWMEKGKKCTAHFLRLNRSNAVKKNIMRLYKTNGVSLMAPQDILGEDVDYFKTIFSFGNEPESQNVNIFSWMIMIMHSPYTNNKVVKVQFQKKSR